ncbi:MAG TPA: phosphatidylglycerol lysyltransferase domain-containing protein [Mycobacteriales bacterium]
MTRFAAPAVDRSPAAGGGGAGAGKGPAPALRRTAATRRISRTASRTASLVALATWLLGVLTVVSALLPPERSRFRLVTELLPYQAADSAAAVAAALGVLLLYIAGGLRRRKRRAWTAAVAVTLVVALSHLAKGLDVEEAAASVAVLVLLLACRREFRAEVDPAGRGIAVRRFLQLAGLGSGIGLLLLTVYDDGLAGSPSFGDKLREVLLGLVGVSGPVRFTSDRPADLVGSTLLAFGLLTVLVTAYFVLRSAEPAAALAPGEETRLRGLLERNGRRDSLGYFALRRDKSVVWSPSGKAAVAYRVLHGVLLASGDPIGDPEAWPGAIDAALELARRHAWTPAVIGAGERGATVWARHGLSAYELGDEAVLDVATFGLEGRAMRGVRQAVSRVERAGVTACVRRAAEVDAGELRELTSRAAAWRDGGVERGFSMALSRIGDPADPCCVVVTARRADGSLCGLLHFVPWGPDGLSLDLMRRARDADNGLNEFLVVALAAAAPALGVRRLSLNFAVLRAALERGERLGAGPVSRAWRALLLLASHWWQIETLYRFNAKFRPAWEPRFLCYPSARDLPRVALAALEAEAFLARPGAVRRLLRRD